MKRATPIRLSIKLPIAALCLLVLLGCAQTRDVQISTRPPDAIIKVNGLDYGRAPVTVPLVFKRATDTHLVTANRPGYKESTVQLTRDEKRSEILIELRPLTRVIHLSIEPHPAVLKIDGQALTEEPVRVYSKELEFTVDEKRNWTTYTVTAERPGFQTAETKVSWPDTSQYYRLKLEPMRKDLKITSDPPGATVSIDGQTLGTTPLIDSGRAFPVDIDTDQFQTQALRLEKPGYDPVELDISWDEGKTDYHIDFKVKTKQVRIITDPPDANVYIEGAKPDRDGAMTVYTLQFPPINEQGELRTYHGTVTKKTEDSEWEPVDFTISWDNGRQDYAIELKEILTRPVPLIAAVMQRTDQGWECVPEETMTMGMKELTEGPSRPTPVAITRLARGTSMGTLAIAPDGSKILFTILTGTDRNTLRSQMMVVRPNGGGSAEILTDGKTLDITPSFTPGGDRVLFSSNRAGRRMQIWSMSATGQPGVTRLTTSETNDVWPSMDSDPRPRLFYQAHVDIRPDPRIYMTQVGTVFQTDLTLQSGMQPRISPKNNEILFTVINDETGKRDVYRMNDTGGHPQNLTNTPDADECDPVWSRDGTKIAFASDRGADANGRHNFDIWVLDLSRPDEPIQVTVNGSLDDNPLFDPTGDALYFRSNRGGEWGIWRIRLK